jgi:outer membrane protein assembly factor BamB
MREDETLGLPEPEEPVAEETALLDSVEETKLIDTDDEHTIAHPLPRAYLLVISGPMTGRRFTVGLGKTTVGRDAAHNDIVLAGDRRASRRQATIQAMGSHYAVSSRRARGRTFVNRHRVTDEEEFALSFGDEIDIGSSIFRFTREGNWDWAPPRHAGSFWSRSGHRVLLALSLALAAVAALVGIGAARYLAAAAARPRQLALSELWSRNVGPGAVPAGAGYHYAPALARLPGTARCVIAAVGGDGRLELRDGASGEPVGRVREANPEQGVAVGDVNGDGQDEFVFVTRQGEVAAVSPVTGLDVWNRDIVHGSLLSPVVADVDGDGLADVVVAATDGAVFRRQGSRTGGRFAAMRAGDDAIAAPPVLTDLNGDGRLDVVLVNREGQVTTLDAVSGEQRDLRVYPAAEVGQHTVPFSPFPRVASAPASAPIAGRAERLLVTASSDQDGLVFATAGGPGSVRWASALRQVMGTLLTRAVGGYPSPVLADFDGDGDGDAAIGTVFGPLVALGGRDGRAIWTCPGGWDSLLATPALYDFDKDGTADVVLADGQGAVHIISGRTGKAIADVPPTGQPVRAAPLVGDVNGDGFVDIVIQDAADALRVLASNSATPERGAFWPMDGGTGGREGVESFAGFAVGPRQGTLALAVALALLLAALNAVIILRRRALRRRLEELDAR